MRFKPLSFDVGHGIRGLSFTVGVPVNYEDEINNAFKDFKNGLDFEFKSVKKKRSLDANSFLWHVCDKIAQVIHSTKEDVYRTAVKQVGVYEQLSFTDANALKRFAENWQANGLGWIVEVVDDELMIVNAYYGSSRYHTDEMSVLIENVIDAAKELDIEVKQQEEIDSLLREWEHG